MHKRFDDFRESQNRMMNLNIKSKSIEYGMSGVTLRVFISSLIRNVLVFGAICSHIPYE